ncbi:MAG: type IV pilus twitching motility protein PilT [Clostridiales bacterium]|nr:type IV pilus twitching motility protein PilT [Clostridiales bacterium]
MELSQIIEEAVLRNASDIHITAGIPPVVRVSGELIRLGDQRLLPEDTERIANQIFEIAGYKNVLSERGEVDFSFSVPQKGRFRSNIYKQRGSIAIAIRLIPMDVPDISTLNIPDAIINLWSKNRGLVLVTGPTGVGKSTTLAALIDVINERRNCHIITLEDPVEYLHRHKNGIISQREIGTDSRSFGNALRAALREDPDVIMIGEMRDTETMSIALTAAETGHLVFGTLHTMGASKTIDRIVDSFPDSQQQQVRVQLASVLQAVVTQQLLPSRDSMIPAFEIMMCTHAISNLIREGKTHQIDNMIQTGGRYGMQTMDGYLLTLYKKGFISQEDLLTYAFDPEMIQKLL